jgi:hypothetical protein
MSHQSMNPDQQKTDPDFSESGSETLAKFFAFRWFGAYLDQRIRIKNLPAALLLTQALP